MLLRDRITRLIEKHKIISGPGLFDILAPSNFNEYLSIKLLLKALEDSGTIEKSIIRETTHYSIKLKGFKLI